jgi:hypothetical protein
MTSSSSPLSFRGPDLPNSRLVLALICLVGLVLRLIGLKFGLPAVYNPDEVSIMARALTFATGTLNPHNFLYPTFLFYVLFVWVGIYLGFVWISGRVESLSALQQLYFTDPTGIYLAGRTLGVVAGTATIVAVYRLAARLTTDRTALAAAAFLAVAPLAVRDAHYIKHDVPATLTIVLAYLAMTRIWPCARPEGPTRRDTLLAGAACGVAFSTHYYCIFLVFPLAFAIFQGWRTRGGREWLPQIIWGGVASVVVFFALSPFILVEPLTAWRDITANRQIVVDRAVTAGAFAPAKQYLTMLWVDAGVQTMAIMAILGVIRMLVLAPARAVFLLAFPVPFFLFIMNTAPASRYLNPTLPFLVIFAALTLDSVDSLRSRPRRSILWLVAALVALPALGWSVLTGYFFRQDDTRTLAARYIEANIPAESTILIQPYSAPLTPSKAGLTEALTHHIGSVDKASTKFRLQLSVEPYPAPAYRLIYLGRGGLDADKLYVDPAELGGANGLKPLTDRGVAYLVVTRYNRPDPVTLPFLTALAREGRRMAVFSPYKPRLSEAEQLQLDPFLHNTDARITGALERPGPLLEIWQLK